MSLLRIATYPHILLQCVGAMVPEWLWRRGIFIPLSSAQLMTEQSASLEFYLLFTGFLPLLCLPRSEKPDTTERKLEAKVE